LNKPKVFDAYCAGQKDGDYYITIHKVKGSPKTLEQLGYYYAVIVPTAFKQMVEDGNEKMVVKVGDKFKEVPLTEDVVDLLLKEACAKFDGKKVTLKRNMSKLECSEFIDRWYTFELDDRKGCHSQRQGNGQGYRHTLRP